MKTNQIVKPIDARICRRCSNLVTKDETCPLCDRPTKPHPDREESEGYCCKCAEGPFPSSDLHVVTWNEDPYMQIEDGDLITVCLKCHTEEDAE